MEAYQEVPTKEEPEQELKKKKFKLVPGSFPQIVAVTISMAFTSWCAAKTEIDSQRDVREPYISHAMSKAGVIENRHVLVAQLLTCSRVYLAINKCDLTIVRVKPFNSDN